MTYYDLQMKHYEIQIRKSFSRLCSVFYTYFHITAGQISHFSGISLFHNTNLRRDKNRESEKL